MTFWDAPETVAQYSCDRWHNHVLRGERQSFASCYNHGLAQRRVLDLGCGAGRTSRALHEVGAEVIGLDASKNLVQAARQRCPSIQFCVGNAESLAFTVESFDVVLFSFNGLDYIYPKDIRLRAVAEVWRVLRPEGYFIFSHHNLLAFYFGWYKFIRPWKLCFRAKHIVNGTAFKDECYMQSRDSDHLMCYYARPKQVIGDLCENGFELVTVCPNSLLLSIVQRLAGTQTFTRLAETWPYYVFRKRPTNR